MIAEWIGLVLNHDISQRADVFLRSNFIPCRYRPLFEIGPGDTLRLVDFILRRDLDRWLAAGGR